MKKPTITNQNCRSPWTFDQRIRRWEVLFEDEVIEHKGKEVEVALVLVEGRDVFVVVESTCEMFNEPDATVLDQARTARKAVKSMERFRWKFPRVRCYVAVGERRADVTHLI